jgi:hypothetical protein
MKVRHLSLAYSRRPWYGWLTDEGWAWVAVTIGGALYLVVCAYFM